jgi:hypothetical protein
LLDYPSTEPFADNVSFRYCSFTSAHIDTWNYNINIKRCQV